MSAEPVQSREITPNVYPWNDDALGSASRQDPVAFLLHVGICALCEQIAKLTDAVRGAAQ